MTCNVVLLKNIHPKLEDLELIKACFVRDIAIYMDMLKDELTHSFPKFLLSEGGIVRIESDREKEIMKEIYKIQKEYLDKYAPYISF